MYFPVTGEYEKVMDVQEYIASGILELYVAGQLSERENREVATHAKAHPEILSEIEAIEASILSLSKTAAPKTVASFDHVLPRLKEAQETKVVKIEKKKTPWPSYLGWAASLLLAAGLFYVYNQNTQLQSRIEVVEEQRSDLEKQIFEANQSLEKSETLLTSLRDKNITVIPLGGQQVSPDSYAKAYWNKAENKVFIDAQGLPTPPKGMVYQVWSLTLNPLTPTSVGLLDEFETDENRVFALSNANASEAFGITLEPAGGSESPNLEQLYALGTVSTP